MNEYQDQATWYRLEQETDTGWDYVMDADTREDARTIGEALGISFRVRRMSGRPE